MIQPLAGYQVWVDKCGWLTKASPVIVRRAVSVAFSGPVFIQAFVSCAAVTVAPQGVPCTLTKAYSHERQIHVLLTFDKSPVCFLRMGGQGIGCCRFREQHVHSGVSKLFESVYNMNTDVCKPRLFKLNRMQCNYTTKYLCRISKESCVLDGKWLPCLQILHKLWNFGTTSWPKTACGWWI